MFEVDWADYDCERVGQRRARKAAEREQKKRDDASSGRRSTSTRTSCSSDRHHLRIFGSIGRKKQVNPSLLGDKGNEPPVPGMIKCYGDSKRGSMTSQADAASPAMSSRRDSSVRPENGPSGTPPGLSMKGAGGSMDFRWPESSDRSSKESVLSKMTQLTVPTLESQGDNSVTDAVCSPRSRLHAHHHDSPLAAKPSSTIYEHHSRAPFGPPRVGFDSQITPSPRLQTPKSALPNPCFPESDNSVSEFIDDWFLALHKSPSRSARMGSHGTMRRVDASQLPNAYQAVLNTPTRHLDGGASTIPHRARLTRFVADDPDDWRSPEDWDRPDSPTIWGPARANGGVHAHEERLSSTSADFGPICSRDGVIEDPADSQQEGHSLESPTDTLKGVDAQQPDAPGHNKCHGKLTSTGTTEVRHPKGATYPPMASLISWNS